MVAIALVAGAFSTLGAALLAYGTAVATFRFDLDPDNHGIAADTSRWTSSACLSSSAPSPLLGVPE